MKFLSLFSALAIFIIANSAFALSDLDLQKIILRIEGKLSEVKKKIDSTHQEKSGLEVFIRPTMRIRKKIKKYETKIERLQDKEIRLASNIEFYKRLRSFLKLDLSLVQSQIEAAVNYLDWYESYLFFNKFFASNKNFWGRSRPVKVMGKKEFFRELQRIFKKHSLNYLKFKRMTKIVTKREIEDPKELLVEFNCVVDSFGSLGPMKTEESISKVGLMVNSKIEKFATLYNAFLEMHRLKKVAKGRWHIENRKYQEIDSFVRDLNHVKGIFLMGDQQKINRFLQELRLVYPTSELSQHNYCQLFLKSYF